MLKIVSSCPSYTVFQDQHQQEDDEEYYEDDEEEEEGQFISPGNYNMSPQILLDDTNSASSFVDGSESQTLPLVGGSSTTVKPLLPPCLSLAFPQPILQAQLRYGATQIRQPLVRPLQINQPITIPPPRRPPPQLVKATNFGGILLRPPVSIIAPESGSSTPNFSITRHLLEGQGNSPGTSSSSGSAIDRINERIKIIKRPPGVVGNVAQIRQTPVVPANMNDPGDPNCPYTCHLCDKTYVHLRSLKDHLKAHRGLTQCPECGKSFSKVANMRAHFAVQHASKREPLSPGFSPMEVLQSQMMQSIQTELTRRNNSNSSPPGSGSSSSGAN